MTDKNDGGSAFPFEGGTNNGYGPEPGMTLRDWFATHCPDSWIADNTPKTVGEMRDALIAKGILPASARQNDVLRSYSETHKRKLSIALRWDYADAMLAARSKT